MYTLNNYAVHAPVYNNEVALYIVCREICLAEPPTQSSGSSSAIGGRQSRFIPNDSDSFNEEDDCENDDLLHSQKRENNRKEPPAAWVGDMPLEQWKLK